MNAQGEPPGGWPNRGPELVRTAVVMATLSTLVAGWRLVVRFRVTEFRMTWTNLSDWLMLGGVILNVLANVPYCVYAAHGGQGRLMEDPFWLEPGRLSYEVHVIFISQTLNVYAMFLVKASIVAFLMALDLGRSYRIIIWISAVIVLLCNFVMMLILHFAYCRPYYSRWDFSVKGDCWPASVSEATAYVQIASNIITDLIYAAAPLVYLRHVQISRQTQWGVRIVFLMALIGTSISIAKIPITYRFLRSKEFFSDAIDLSICALNEVCVGIIIANLPPLRKIILGMLSDVLPTSMSSKLGASSRNQGGPSHRMSTVPSSKRRSMVDELADEWSERYMLDLEDGKAHGINIRDDEARTQQTPSVKEHV
ncbi:hypothetical protein EG328_002862 [Venturia inaequalis]|uniref:Rhodopsin domain-containing protein n=1 Tax=Venturia inaequalis TaxID=5025 RepID=A0A8H3VLB6_VENIN|nr:hypothetical protein EG328_002862 [Venturia inaequalis]KAE9990045.1 hypothetical protein EG327_001936 [Venturia inaequalis]